MSSGPQDVHMLVTLTVTVFPLAVKRVSMVSVRDTTDGYSPVAWSDWPQIGLLNGICVSVDLVVVLGGQHTISGQ